MGFFLFSQGTERKMVCPMTSASAAGGRASELTYCAAVDKIEEKRKSEDFIGHRKRGGQIPRSGISLQNHHINTQWAEIA